MQPIKIEASCTWGFCEDVSLYFESANGEKVYIGLNIEQAMQLVADLLKAGLEANKINTSYMLDMLEDTIKKEDSISEEIYIELPF